MDVREGKKRGWMQQIVVKENGAHQQGSFGQFTLLCAPGDGDDVALTGDELCLRADLPVLLNWTLLTCNSTTYFTFFLRDSLCVTAVASCFSLAALSSLSGNLIWTSCSLVMSWMRQPLGPMMARW